MEISLRTPRVKEYALIATLALLLVVLFHDLAQAAQEDVNTLQLLASQNETIDKWWEEVWVKTFRPGVATGGTTLSDYFFNNICRWFLLVGLFFWIYQLGEKATRVGGARLGSLVPELLLPVVISAALLANNAQLGRDLAWAVRSFSHNAQQGVLQTRILDIEIASSLKDVFTGQVAGAQLAEQVQYCSAMPHPNVILTSATRPENPTVPLTPQQIEYYDYMECFQKTLEFMKEQQAATEQAQCSSVPGIQQTCSFTTRFLKKSYESFSKGIQDMNRAVARGERTFSNPVQKMAVDFIAGVAGQSASRPTLAAIQYWAVSFLEMALFVDALICPLAIAVAIIPSRLNMTAGWIISIFTIVLAQIVNAVISGVAAMQLAQSSTYFLSDTRFDLALGLLAPLVSFAVIGGGGFFAAKTFMSAGSAGTGAIVSLGSSLTTSMYIGISRAMSRKS